MWILSFVLLLLLASFTTFAQQSVSADLAAQPANLGLIHKIRMADFIISSPEMQQRLRASDDEQVKDLFARAMKNFHQMNGYFDQERFLEAEAILDFVLRDLSAASQLLSAGSRKQSRFKQSLRRLDSFELPQWKSLSAHQSEYLQMQLVQIGELRAAAEQLAESQDYDAAVEGLDRAYSLKAEILEKLPHEQKVIYDLVFDSIHEKYDYLNQRFYHYLELVDLALARTEIKMQTRKLVDDYRYRSIADLEEAEKLKYQEKLAEAIGKLEETIKQLVSALTILGVHN